MNNFNDEIIDLLNTFFSKGEQFVESITLASYGFSIQFVDFTVRCEERVFATIDGKDYVWEDAPSSDPWGALGRQLATSAILEKNSLLQINFESCDLVKVETKEHQYESVIFDFGTKDGALIMEIF